MIKFTVVSTKFGWVGMCASNAGLVLLTLPESSRKAAISKVKEVAADAVEDASGFEDFACRLGRYFEGEEVFFPDRLDLHKGTEFQKAVWKTTRSIPRGETRTYAWVAQQMGNSGACRAVGGALARNPFPIIVPCHRVLASGNKMGGFSGGLALKRRLLDLEAGLPSKKHMSRQ